MVNEKTLTEADIASFRERGFLKVEGLFDGEAIERLRVLKESCAKIAYDPSHTVLPAEKVPRKALDIESFKAGFQLNSAMMAEIFESANMSRLRRQLSKAHWIYTHAIGIELDTVHRGLDWHVGLLAFCHLMAAQIAYTIWVPLDAIDARGQGGGLAIAPESVFSGRETIRAAEIALEPESLDSRTMQSLLERERKLQARRTPDLEAHRVEYSFEPGDVLIFNRYVYHRSCPLGPAGPLKSRRAFILRLTEADAVLNYRFYLRLKGFAETTGIIEPLQLADVYKTVIDHNQKLVDSGMTIRF